MKNKNQTMIFSALVAGLVVCGANTWQARGAPVGCGAVLTADTTLQSDLDCSGAALVVGTGNITVNLNGHTLRSLDGFGVGISIAGHNGVTVKNGVIDGFQEAILAQESSDLTLKDLTIPSISGNGMIPGWFGVVAAIRIEGGQKVTIKDSSISAGPPFDADGNPGPDAIIVENVKDVNIQNVNVEGGFSGVDFVTCDGPSCPPYTEQLRSSGEVKNCTFANNYISVLLLLAADVTIMDNVISGATVGILPGGYVDFLPAENVTVIGNELFGNYWAIFGYLFNTTGEEWPPGPFYNCTIKGNWAHDNYQGFALVNAQNCTVSENLVENNYRFGIALFGPASGNKVSKNTVTGTSENFGIGLMSNLDNPPCWVASPTGNLISENIATGNSPVDLFHSECSTPNVWRKNVYDEKSGADIP